MLKYKKINLVYIIISLLLFFFYGKEVISVINDSDEYSQPFFRLMIFLLWVVNLLVVFINFRSVLNIKSSILNIFIKIFLLFLLLLCFISDAKQSVGTNIFRGLYLLLPFLTFIGFYVVYKKEDYKQLLPRFFMILLLWFSYVFYSQYNIIVASLDVENQAYNSAYVPLFTLPLVLCLNKKWLRIGAVVLVASLVLLSNKRGGFVGLSLAMIVYFIIQGIISKKTIPLIKKVGVFFLIILSIWKVYDFVVSARDNFFLYRLEKLQEDGGSGRIDLYLQVIEGIKNSSFVQILLGHGDNQVIYLTKEGYSAHNDFLEVFYCYGILMFLAYITLHYLLIKKSLLLIKTKNKYAGPMAVSVIIFFVFSFISHVIIYQYFIFLVVFWAMVLELMIGSKYLKNVIII